MPAIIPAVVGVVVGELAGYVVGALASAAASAAIANREKVRANRRALAQYNANLRDQTITVRGGVNPRPIVYGRTAVGGQLIYAESFGAAKEHLLLVIALAHGEVDAIETVYFNDVPLTIDGANLVTNAPYAFANDNYYQTSVTVPGSPYQVALAGTPLAGVSIQDVTAGMGGGDNGSPPILQAGTDYTLAGTTVTFAASLTGRTVQISYSTAGTSQSYAAVWRYTGAAGQDLSTTMLALGAPSWTAADKCQGMAALIVRLTYAENVWPSGIPNVKAVVRGRKVFDPRTSNTVYSNNAALCARDYLTFQYGVNAVTGKIDDAGATTPSANICDEDVQLTATPTYQDRYTANGVLSTGDDRLTNLGLLAESMAGSINYSQGKWRIRAGAYTAPALTLDESKLAGDGVQIVPYASRRSLINGAKATYINGDEAYIEDQAPEWSSSTFIADDGGAALTEAIVLPLVTDHVRAQRLSKIRVNRSREQLTLSCRCNFTTYTWQVGDMVSVTLARYGFSAKPFRITQRGFSVEGGMTFTLREEPNGLYDWNLGEASVLTGAGNTTLPNPAVVGVPTITGITSAQWLYKAGDGTFVARIRVAVTPPADEYVRKGGKLQLQYKRGDWTQDWALVEAAGDATQIWIDPAFDAQNYIIRVRAVNSAGFASAWTAMQSHTCQGRPGAIANLLQNSDWSQDLGFGSTGYSDTRALRNWNPGGNPAIFGRNYDSGKSYNIGLGGCWFYIPSNTVGHYAYVYQDVPVAAGVEFEASVYVKIDRANVILYLRFLNAAKDTVLLDVTDSRNTGATAVGDAYKPLSNPRLWCKGTAPAGTAYVQFICLVECTASSSPYPFTAWSNALLCIAPSGVTRETATPWVDDSVVTVSGQVIEVASSYIAGPATYTDSDFTWYDSYVLLQWTPRASGRMQVTLTFNLKKNSATSLAGVGLEGRIRLYDTVTFRNSPAQPIWPPANDGIAIHHVITVVGVFDVVGGRVHTLNLQYRPDASAISWTVAALDMNLQITRAQ